MVSNCWRRSLNHTTLGPPCGRLCIFEVLSFLLFEKRRKMHHCPIWWRISSNTDWMRSVALRVYHEPSLNELWYQGLFFATSSHSFHAPHVCRHWFYISAILDHQHSTWDLLLCLNFWSVFWSALTSLVGHIINWKGGVITGSGEEKKGWRHIRWANLVGLLTRLP